MDLKNAVARLERAGNERSGGWEKLRTAIDQLAYFLMAAYPDYVTGTLDLPWRVHFQFWQSQEWQLRWSNDGVVHYELTHNTKHREPIMAFTALVANGWIEEVAAQMESEAATFHSTADRIIAVIGK